MTPQHRPRRLALIGLMGAGKSRVGKLLASALGWPFHDADLLIEAGAGRSVSKIFADEGEAGFRRRESRVVETLAGTAPPLVAAMGGGVVEREENRERLARGFFVIWIELDPDEAARRLEGGKKRPLLRNQDATEVLRTLARRRGPWYEEIADLRLRSGPASRPEDLRDSLLDHLERHDR